ncbi:hypothetical protein [Paraburkholderia caribensis]|nr:hypothetical protein [Paraburkholderia caribensis]ALP62804.1 hypothetical protein AN416_09490 [Paraburkholderia caribensis]AUT51964.1 hypothetical protein C2L66_08915 [Paraburkholderia caribensis]
MAASLSHELRTLANALDAHAKRNSRRKTHQRGYAPLAVLASLSFVAATYFNDIAWLDAALSLAAQLTAIFLAKRSNE